jgi:hypothetical protein
MAEIFRDGTPIEIAQILLFFAGMGFCLMMPLVWICSKIIALKEKPDRRALWTAIIPYAAAAFISIFGFDDLFPVWLALIVPLPGAIMIYFWQRYTYRQGWIDDDKVPEGMKLENSDWRIGLGIVVSLIVAAAIKVALRQ